MDNFTDKAFRLYIKRHKKRFLLALSVVLMIAAATTVMLAALNLRPDGNTPTYASQEFDPDEVAEARPGAAWDASALPAFSEDDLNQLRTELADAHAALGKANAGYQAEMEARKADAKALENSKRKAAALESEKNELLSELDAQKAELQWKTPPELDFKKILGMYEGYGELVTLTYSYEVTVESKSEGNILTKKTLLYLIPGTLKIGVNFDKVKNGIVADDAEKTVTVTIPAAYFISNEIDESNVERYDVSRGVFSKVEDKDYLNVAITAKEKAQEQVTGNGMLPYAQRLAGLEFIGLLEPVTSKFGYQIVVVYGK